MARRTTRNKGKTTSGPASPPEAAPAAAKPGLPFRIIDSEFGFLVPIHVQPNASRSGIVGLFGDVVKVAVTKPPDQGQANEALIETLAEAFGLKKSQVTIRAGWTTKDKTICLVGLKKDQVVRVVNDALSKIHGG